MMGESRVGQEALFYVYHGVPASSWYDLPSKQVVAGSNPAGLARFFRPIRSAM